MKSKRIESQRAHVAAVTLLLAGICLNGVASGEGLLPEDRQRGLDYLIQTKDGVVEATKGLSQAQFNFKSAPDRWSVAEVVEHLALTEDFFFGDITERILKAPAGPADRDLKAMDQMILTAIPDRTQRATAPEPVAPKGQWSPAEALDHFVQSRARTTGFLKSAAGLRQHVVDSPLGQPMDAYQWLLFLSAHSERHTKQILEVKADSGFPKH